MRKEQNIKRKTLLLNLHGVNIYNSALQWSIAQAVMGLLLCVLWERITNFAQMISNLYSVDPDGAKSILTRFATPWYA